jgi:hypothetical protein
LYKKSTHEPADIYGPYIRSNKNDKWHWINECSEYPKNNDPIVRYSSTRPDVSELCIECIRLEEESNK